MVIELKPTHRQELFLLETMKTANATEAWQRIYGTKRRSSAQALASRTLAKPHVRKRLIQLQERQMKKSEITVEKILSDYQYALELAKGQGKASDITAAATAQAKLVGLLRERVETGMVGDFGDDDSMSEILEKVAKEAGPEAAMKLASIFGLDTPKSQEIEESELLTSKSPSDAVN